MHTCAHVLAYTGTLTHHAEARTKLLDGVNSVPVLCMDIELNNAAHTPMRVEQPFPALSIEQTRAAAHRLKKGTTVTVEVPLVSVRMAATATHVHVIPEPKQEEIPCPQ